MRKKPAALPKPTAAELEILTVLWRSGTATVREVHAELQEKQSVTYTTVLKLLQIMAEKGLVTREESGRAHIYSPALKQEDTQRQIVRDLLDRAFGGSAAQLVLRALAEQPASREEVQEIRQMLDRIEQKGKSDE